MHFKHAARCPLGTAAPTRVLRDAIGIHQVGVLLLEREDVLKQSMPICRYSTKLRHGFVGLSM